MIDMQEAIKLYDMKQEIIEALKELREHYFYGLKEDDVERIQDLILKVEGK
jgi:hypothetical protein